MVSGIILINKHIITDNIIKYLRNRNYCVETLGVIPITNPSENILYQ